MSGEGKTGEKPPITLIVFGLDEAQKPHASGFGPADAELAEKAAGLMGMRTLRVETDEHQEIAAKLPKGRVFSSGRAFTPFVKAALYERLATLSGTVGGLEGNQASKPAQTAKRPPAASPALTSKASAESKPLKASMPMPTTWAEIQVGTLVLVSEGPLEGFYECVVVAEPGPDLFKVKFRDFPDEPLLVRKRQHLALLHPADSGRG